MQSPADELALIGAQKQEAVVLGRKFKFKTLDADQEAMAVNATAPFSGASRDRILKMEKLARAIESIEGQPFALSDQEKTNGMRLLDKAREAIYKWQPPVVDRIFAEYEKLEKLRDEVVLALEKNGQSLATSTGAGR